MLEDIQKSELLLKEFQRWKEKEREQLLDFCTGVRGVKILSDSFFKEVLNPEYAPERLNDFLSLIMKQKEKLSLTRM